jgi:hypothetical protein
MYLVPEVNKSYSVFLRCRSNTLSFHLGIFSRFNVAVLGMGYWVNYNHCTANCIGNFLPKEILPCFGIGGGALVGRLTQFLLASAFWIGRIDEPFLADNVRLAGYKFDYVSLNYLKEILVHEAHRHPFIERLGAMSLMRLGHKSFGSDTGGCWRQFQLFVLTLTMVVDETSCLSRATLAGTVLVPYRTYHRPRSPYRYEFTVGYVEKLRPLFRWYFLRYKDLQCA